MANIHRKNRTVTVNGWKCGWIFKACLVREHEVTQYTKALFYALMVFLKK
jgi:hypothetical protein